MKQLLSPPQDKGDVGAKELDSLKSDRLRTVQLNVCKSEEVEKAVEIVRSSLEDPEKGRGHLGTAGTARAPFLSTTLHLLVSCQKTAFFLLHSRRKWVELNTLCNQATGNKARGDSRIYKSDKCMCLVQVSSANVH